jgi:16S rRNA (cytosine1402-N4)-methyltransferase
MPHLPVMLSEVFFEGTVGAGGHASAILEAHPEIETYIACDRDPDAIEIAKKSLSPWKDKVKFVQGNFADLDEHLQKFKVNQIDGFFLI